MSRYLVSERPSLTGEFATGDTVTMSVFDLDGNVVAIGSSNCPEVGGTGVYKWETSELTNPIPALGITKLLFIMTDTGSNTFAQTVEWGGLPDILHGLMHGNMHLDNCVYNSTHGGLQSARVRIYDDAANVGTATGVIATYNIAAVISGPGQFTSWKQERV